MNISCSIKFRCPAQLRNSLIVGQTNKVFPRFFWPHSFPPVLFSQFSASLSVRNINLFAGCCHFNIALALFYCYAPCHMPHASWFMPLECACTRATRCVLHKGFDRHFRVLLLSGLVAWFLGLLTKQLYAFDTLEIVWETEHMYLLTIYVMKFVKYLKKCFLMFLDYCDEFY